MAIRIVNVNPDPSVVKKCICRRCGITLEYTPSDVVERISKDYTGGTDLVKEIKCPGCGFDINVS